MNYFIHYLTSKYFNRTPNIRCIQGPVRIAETKIYNLPGPRSSKCNAVGVQNPEEPEDSVPLGGPQTTEEVGGWCSDF